MEEPFALCIFIVSFGILALDVNNIGHQKNNFRKIYKFLKFFTI